MQIIHPCDAFAQRAGYDSWAAALDAMKTGKIVSASAPPVGKSIWDLTVFSERIQKDGLLLVSVPHSDFGLVSVGFRAHFPTKTLARIDAEPKLPAVSLGGNYRTL